MRAQLDDLQHKWLCVPGRHHHGREGEPVAAHPRGKTPPGWVTANHRNASRLPFLFSLARLHFIRID